MSAEIKATENDLKIARIGVEIQAEAHGVDLSVEANRNFIEHVIKFNAATQANFRFIQNALNETTLPTKEK